MVHFHEQMVLFVTAEVVAGSAAWLGRGLSCVCAQRRESDPRPSFDLTPAQVTFIYLFWGGGGGGI